MQVLCRYCKNWIEFQNFLGHLRFHEPEIQDTSILSLVKTKAKVLWLHQKFPSVRSNNMVLLQKFYQYFPSQDGVRLIWDAGFKTIEWNRNPKFEEFMNLTQPETITRAGRSIRRKYPEYQASEKIRYAREVKEAAYKNYFGRIDQID